MLNNLVSGYFDFAEVQAIKHRPMYMNDYIKHLDAILSSTGEVLLMDAGMISHEQAMDKAKIDRINYLARQSRERELTTEEKEEQLELRNEYRASFKRGLMSELDRVYVVDDKGKQQKLIKDNENK